MLDLFTTGTGMKMLGNNFILKRLHDPKTRLEKLSRMLHTWLKSPAWRQAAARMLYRVLVERWATAIACPWTS